MAYNDPMMNKWVSAHTEFAQKVNHDFLQNPAATLDKVYPMSVSYVSRDRVLEKTLKQYLTDCGVQDFLGECSVYQYSWYTSALFKGRTDICCITNIVYGHWNNMPENVIKESFLVSSPDKKTAIGLAVKVTDGKGGHDLIIMGRKQEDTWTIPQENWENINKQAGLLGDTIELYAYTLISLLLPDKCPNNAAKLKVDKVIS